MRTTAFISFLLFITVFCFGQSNQSDTTKTKPSSGMQSGLAVSDAGAPSEKPKTENKKKIANPIEQIKKNLTHSASSSNTGGTKNNLAVSDEGAPADKNNSKGKTSRKAASSTTSQEKPSQGSSSTISSSK